MDLKRMITMNGCDTNPFATRWIHPDHGDFRFNSDDSLKSCLSHCERQGWRGQIVGPHGAGKSTLLATLAKSIEQQGRRLIWYRLHDRQRALPRNRDGDLDWNEQTLVMVDGYEQLSSISAWNLRRRVRRNRAGLIVTTHRVCRGLAVIRHVQPDVERFEAFVGSLLARHQCDGALAISVIQRAFWQHRGNQREALMELYDEFERLAASRRKQLAGQSVGDVNPISLNCGSAERT